MLDVGPEDIQRTAAEACRRLPGAVALYAFGSLVDGSADRFSDVDLELITIDLASTLKYRQSMYAEIDVPLLEWRIHPSSSDWASTVLFRHITPYQRLDIGFRRWAPDFAAKLPTPSVLLWQQSAPGEVTPPLGEAGYSPEAGSFEHFVVEMFLSANRYAKARKRGQDLTSYRFASALANALLTLTHAGQHRDPAKLGQKLSTQDYVDMDSRLAEETVFGLLETFNFSTLEHMDRSIIGILHQSKCLLTGTRAGEQAPNQLLDQLLTFVMRELELPI